MDKTLLLTIQAVCNSENVAIPWDKIGAALGEHITGGAVIQHLAKLRGRMVAAEIAVPPPLRRGGSSRLASNQSTPKKCAKAGGPGSSGKKRAKSPEDTDDIEYDSDGEYGKPLVKRSKGVHKSKRILKHHTDDDEDEEADEGNAAVTSSAKAHGKVVKKEDSSDADGADDTYVGEGASFTQLEGEDNEVDAVADSDGDSSDDADDVQSSKSNEKVASGLVTIHLPSSALSKLDPPAKKTPAHDNGGAHAGTQANQPYIYNQQPTMGYGYDNGGDGRLLFSATGDLGGVGGGMGGMNGMGGVDLPAFPSNNMYGGGGMGRLDGGLSFGQANLMTNATPSFSNNPMFMPYQQNYPMDFSGNSGWNNGRVHSPTSYIFRADQLLGRTGGGRFDATSQLPMQMNNWPNPHGTGASPQSVEGPIVGPGVLTSSNNSSLPTLTQSTPQHMGISPNDEANPQSAPHAVPGGAGLDMLLPSAMDDMGEGGFDPNVGFDDLNFDFI